MIIKAKAERGWSESRSGVPRIYDHDELQTLANLSTLVWPRWTASGLEYVTGLIEDYGYSYV